MSRKPRNRRRGLSEDDRALWEEVARTATPLHPRRHAPAPESDPPRAGVSLPDPPAEREPLVLRPAGRPRPPVTWQAPGAGPGPVGRPEPGLDRRTADRLRKGDRAPDARIDLHGLTAARAHARLDRFMAEAVAAGHRCVLVITGKGSSGRAAEEASFMAPERGVLRRAAPRWLRAGAHAHRILGVYEAHIRHGGAGAFYVYLRKGR